MEFYYRFRTTAALLDGRHELENQEIYFATPQQLNDPMEGFKDICLKGDKIIWRNLLKHYLLCLTRSISLVCIAGADSPPEMPENFVFVSETTLETDALKDIHRQICDSFFADQEINAIPELLGEYTHSVRRDELMFYLSGLHMRALACVMKVFEQKKLVPVSQISSPPPEIMSAKSVHDVIRALNKAMEQDETWAALPYGFLAYGAINKQLSILRRIQGGELRNAPWEAICFEFPEQYVRSLDHILYTKWYMACFVAEHNHAAMWGNYGDGHKGVCLKFRSVQNSASVSCLKLRRIVGWSGGPQGMSSIYGEVDHPFERVNYTNKFVEIDFFRSIGHLPMQALMKDWYSDQNGNVSPCADAMMSNETEWRKQYWANFQTMITTKLEDWRHESEYRVILQSSLGGFEKEEDRKLTYRFSDLEGIIFGMNTPMDERLKIINIILEKCKKETRDKFEFHQAYYSPVTGKIETHPLNLLGAS